MLCMRFLSVLSDLALQRLLVSTLGRSNVASRKYDWGPAALRALTRASRKSKSRWQDRSSTSSTTSREPKNCHRGILQITPPPGPADSGSGPATTWAPNILRTKIRAVRRPRVRCSPDYPDRNSRPVSQNTSWTGGTSASSLISGASLPSHWAILSGLEPGFQRTPCNGCHARVLAPRPTRQIVESRISPDDSTPRFPPVSGRSCTTRLALTANKPLLILDYTAYP